MSNVAKTTEFGSPERPCPNVKRQPATIVGPIQIHARTRCHSARRLRQLPVLGKVSPIGFSQDAGLPQLPPLKMIPADMVSFPLGVHPEVPMLVVSNAERFAAWLSCFLLKQFSLEPLGGPTFGTYPWFHMFQASAPKLTLGNLQRVGSRTQIPQ